jgi:cytochrome c-type biogenesis protein CcmE
MTHSKYVIGSIFIFFAIAYLIFSSIQATAQYFLTIEEVNARSATLVGKNLRISGAVIGDTILYDPQTLKLTFTVAHVPGENREIEAQGGLAKVLHDAVVDTSRPHLRVEYNGPKPDLLRNEAQAIMTGKIGEDGIFYAEELLLKCPTKYEEAIPDQARN